MLPLALGFASLGQTQRTVFGQIVEKINPNNGFIRCVSTEYENHLQSQDASRNTAAFEQWIAPKVENIKNQLLRAVKIIWKFVN